MDLAACPDSTRDVALRIRNAQSGVPLMIPGELPVRVVKPKGQGTAVRQVHVPPVFQSAPDARADSERARYELEGGGALSQRRASRFKTLMATLWRAVYDVTNTPRAALVASADTMAPSWPNSGFRNISRRGAR
jgi:hypothetical protein